MTVSHLGIARGPSIYRSQLSGSVLYSNESQCGLDSHLDGPPDHSVLVPLSVEDVLPAAQVQATGTALNAVDPSALKHRLLLGIRRIIEFFFSIYGSNFIYEKEVSVRGILLEHLLLTKLLLNYKINFY